MLPNISKADYGNLFSARRDRLVFTEDPVTGERLVTDLKEIPLLEVGQFYNVEPSGRLSKFDRDDLVEPADSKVQIAIYRNDVEISSSAFSPGVSKRNRNPEVWEWEGTTESFYEAQAAGFPEELVRGMWAGSPSPEKGKLCGTRKAIKDFTRREIA